MRKPLLTMGKGMPIVQGATRYFKHFLFLLTLLMLNNIAQAQVLYSESVSGDLSGSSPGPTLNVTAAGTYTVSGTLNSPGDQQDWYTINIASGFQITTITYNMGAGSGISNALINFGGFGEYPGPGAGSGTLALNSGFTYPISAGSYSVLVNANFAVGVPWTMSYTVTALPGGSAPSISSNPPNRSICAGANTNFSIAASNATSYQWQVNTGSWSNISNGGVYSGATSATLNITGATSSMNGYQYRAIATGSVSPAATSNAGTLTVNSVTTTSGGQTNVSCNGGNNGTATVVPSGSTSYSYSWAPSGGTAATASGLAAGNYTVTVTGANTCQATRTYSITQPSALTTTSTSQTNVSCNGGNNGTASVVASGGTPGYSYSWAPSGGTAATASGLATGNYTVTITDANSCSITRTFSITQPASSLAAGSGGQNNVSCNGGTNGTATVVASGGTPAYTYSWAPSGGTAATASGLAAGNYTVTVTDANSCTATRTYSLTQPPALVATFGSQTNVSCNGGTNGSATVSATGGTPSYTYSWAPSGGTAATASGLAAGNYTVTVTDANSCTKTQTFSITQPPALSLTGGQTNVSCNSGTNGSATVVASGGTPAYTYSWAPSGGTAATASGLAAGNYTVTVTDANSCTATRTYSVTQPPVLSSTGGQTNVSCNGGTNGTATVVASGGTPAYTYSWAPSGGTAATASGLAAGNYTVTITDANSCTATRTYSVTQPPVLSSTGGQTNVSCNGGTNGTATVVASGGTPGYTYSWAPSGGTAATATGLAAGNYTVTVTDANNCQATRTYSITQPAAITVFNVTGGGAYCDGGAGVTVDLSGSQTGTNYQLYNGATATGSPVAGTGSAISFGNQTAAGIYTVVATNTTTSCTRNMTGSVTVIVNPIPDVNPITNQTLCNGAATNAITFSGAVSGTVYTWTNTNTAIGLAANGTGDIASFTGTNTGNSPITGTITVTPTANTCVGATKTFTITVNPTPTVNTIANQTLCNGTPSNVVNFGSPVSGVTYAWANNTTSIGLGANGAGNSIASFNATNNGTSPVTATITVTPTANTCVGTNRTFTIRVNPTPTVNNIANQTLCNGSATNVVNFGSPVSGTTYAWANNTTSIGLGANGSGNSIASFNAINTSAAPVTATITVTPTANACIGVNRAFTITVNPTPTVDVVANQTVCNNTMTAAVGFSGATTGTVYNWTNNTTSIGLAANGTGDIAAFTATNTTTAPVTATITVTPVFAGSCNGTPTTFTITVNPTPTVNTVGNQTVCNGAATTDVIFGSPTLGTTYAWTNNDPSIGIAASGSGDILSFNGINTTSAPVTATISITPTANACVGPVSTFDITVNPTPVVDVVANQTICNGDMTAAIGFSGAVSGTTYAWTNDNTSIGLPANGNGDIAAFTGTNNTSGIEVATITVTPSANACTGIDGTFTITVNPTPNVDAVSNVVVCNNELTSRIAFSGAVLGTSYSWTNSDPTIGIAANGTGDIISFTATNTSNVPVTATLVVTPTANGCVGASTTFTITVNPTPTVDAISNQVLCNGALTSAVSFTGPVSGSTFAWANNDPSIGLAANGNGDITSFSATNSGTAPVVATITVTPTANSCVGTDNTFTYTVNPTPTVNTISNQVVCNNSSTAAINFSSPVSGATYTWSNNTTSIGLAANGSGNIASFNAVNTTVAPVTATITVIPMANGCVGIDNSFTITVNPTPKLTSVLNPPLICNNSVFNYTPTSATTGTTFAWRRSGVPGISNGGASGTNNPAETLVNLTTEPIEVTYRYTLTANGCTNEQLVKVMVNATPKLTSTLVATPICNNTAFSYTPTSASTGVVFAWTRAAVTGISNPANAGTGNINENLINTTPNPVAVTYIYTLYLNGCSNAQNVTVVVKPTPMLSSPKTAIICSGDEFVYKPTSATTATKFTWSRAQVTGITPATSNGVNGIKEQLLNSTQQPIDVTYAYLMEADGCTNIENVVVTVRPTPIASTIDIKPGTTLCKGTMYQNFSSSTPPAGGAYSWSVKNAELWSVSGNNRSAVVNFPYSGEAQVILTTTTSATGCASKSIYTINVGTGVALKPEVIYYNGRFICLQNNMDTYRWGYDDRTTLDSVMIPNETMQDYKNTAPDFTNRLYWVMTTKDGCMQKSYYNAPTGVAGVNIDAESIKVYPNPATEIVNVELSSVNGKDIELGMHDVAGRLLKKTTFVQGKAQLQVNDMPSGVYMLIVYKDGVKMATSRFIKN